jgi:hypothetical protein
VSSVEDRVHAAMSAAADLATREIPTAPPLRLPPGPAAGDRSRHAPRRWIRWAAPLAAAAAVVALAVSLVLIKGIQNGGGVSRAQPLQPGRVASPATTWRSRSSLTQAATPTTRSWWGTRSLARQ